MYWLLHRHYFLYAGPMCSIDQIHGHANKIRELIHDAVARKKYEKIFISIIIYPFCFWL